MFMYKARKLKATDFDSCKKARKGQYHFVIGPRDAKRKAFFSQHK